jgi:NADH/NAD ratio-sensing transcriptional regulator Rex
LEKITRRRNPVAGSTEIARALLISQSTLNRDITYLRRQARQNLKKHIQDKLPEEYQNCMVGINQVLKICWEIVNKSRNMDNYNGNGQTMTVIDSKTVLQALALINDCNKYKMDLATNRVLLLLMLSSLFRQTRRN